MIGDQMVEGARALLGVPYVHQGRSASGVDCAGLVIFAARRAGEELEPVPADYPRRVREAFLRVILERKFVAYRRRPPPAGAVLLMRQQRGGRARHLAIWTGEDTIIHVDARRGVEKVVETGVTKSVEAAIVDAFVLPGV